MAANSCSGGVAGARPPPLSQRPVCRTGKSIGVSGQVVDAVGQQVQRDMQHDLDDRRIVPAGRLRRGQLRRGAAALVGQHRAGQVERRLVLRSLGLASTGRLDRRGAQPGAGADHAMRGEAVVAAIRLGAQQRDPLAQRRRQHAAAERARPGRDDPAARPANWRRRGTGSAPGRAACAAPSKVARVAAMSSPTMFRLAISHSPAGPLAGRVTRRLGLAPRKKNSL